MFTEIALYLRHNLLGVFYISLRIYYFITQSADRNEYRAQISTFRKAPPSGDGVQELKKCPQIALCIHIREQTTTRIEREGFCQRAQIDRHKT